MKNFTRSRYDAIVIGSGPNGLACAVALALQGLSTVVIEKAESIGGGTRTEELTLPGFFHDVCSAVHPLALASPFLKSLPLQDHGLKWILPDVQIAHPFDDGSVALVRKSVTDTALWFGRDQKSYQNFFEPYVNRFDDLMTEILRPTLHAPRHPGLLTRFGLNALLPASSFARLRFREEKTRALFLGIAAHSSAPLTSMASTGVGLALHLAGHGVGWPIPQGGAKSINLALASYFKSLGGEILTGQEVKSVSELPESEFVFFDLTPRQVLAIAGTSLPQGVSNSFRKFRYGPGVFKMDWALSSPIPWKNSDCALAGTIHLGATPEELTQSERAVNVGSVTARPYVLVSQPSLFDSTRAPSGAHVGWAYCHVPHGSTHDMTEAIENQIERFAPGFKKIILKRSQMWPKDLETRNPNLIGGDISGGLISASQIFFRPRVTTNPYRLDGKRLWICSSSTPPGPGVHGMCGYHAAHAALRSRG
jgi:phytoene dehydrogenase-like protein